jgi:hypothetical protein
VFNSVSANVDETKENQWTCRSDKISEESVVHEWWEREFLEENRDVELGKPVGCCYPHSNQDAGKLFI